jgi:hypothetical protein
MKDLSFESKIWWNKLTPSEKKLYTKKKSLSENEVLELFMEKNRIDSEFINEVFANPANNSKNKGTQRSPFGW